MMIGLALAAAGALAVFDTRGGDDRQRVAERVGEALTDLPGVVEVRRIEPAPAGGGAAYSGRVRDTSGAHLRFGVVVGADLADTQLQRLLPELTPAADGRDWLLVSDASADPRLAAGRAGLQAEVVAALRTVLPGRADAP